MGHSNHLLASEITESASAAAIAKTSITNCGEPAQTLSLNEGRGTTYTGLSSSSRSRICSSP